MNKRFLLLAFAFLFIGKCLGQGLLQTDRPDQTEGVFIVGKKIFQIETGVLAAQNRGGKSNYLLPTTLLKYGLSDHFELQTIVDLVPENGSFGLSPVSLGFKANLAKEKGARPEIAVIGRVQVKNLSSPEFTSPKSLPMFRVAFQNTLSDVVVLGYNVGMQWNEMEKPSYILSASSNFHLSKELVLYAELFNSTRQNSLLNPIADMGLMYAIQNRFIVDASIGKYLNPNQEENLYVTVGFTTRFGYKER
jgi:hypothetical protein